LKPTWLRVFALSAGTILSVVAGNASLGYGVKSASSQAVLSLLLNPWIIAGIVLQIGWMLLRMALLSITPMSIILPLTAGVAYILTGVTSVLFLHERLGHGQWWGLALIFVGVLVIGASDSNNSEEAGP
jgi:multidrug transporter EmrE-like cation transporter